MDYTHSSRKSWTILRNLVATEPVGKENEASTSTKSSVVFKTSNIKPSKQRKAEICKMYADEISQCGDNSTLMADFIAKDVYQVLKKLKTEKQLDRMKYFQSSLKTSVQKVKHGSLGWQVK